MRLSLLVFTQLFSKYFARWKPDNPAGKQNLTQNSHSRSFEVMHFVITGKPTTDCVSHCRCVLMLASFLKFPKKYPTKMLKIAVVDNPTIV